MRFDPHALQSLEVIQWSDDPVTGHPRHSKKVVADSSKGASIQAQVFATPDRHVMLKTWHDKPYMWTALLLSATPSGVYMPQHLTFGTAWNPTRDSLYAETSEMGL